MAFSNYGDVAAALAAEEANWNNQTGHRNAGVRANALAARAWWAGQQGGGSSGSAGPPPPPPRPPPPPPGQKQTSQVKISTVNVVNMNYEATSVEQMEKLYFQNVGGTEILSVARHDTVGGEETVFNNVDNLSELRSQFNPLNILMSTNLNALFSEYGVNIDQKIGALDSTFSMNAEGGMDIEVFNVNTDEYVQVQVAKRVGEEEFGEGTVWYNWNEEK